MIVSRGYVCYHRSKGIERSFMAVLEFQIHILSDTVHRNMTRPFNQYLNILRPGSLCEFSKHLQLRNLGLIIGIMNRPRTQAVPERNSNIVSGTDIADLVKMLIKEILPAVSHTPFSHNGTTAGYHAGETSRRHRNKVFQKTGMNGKVVNPLQSLFD